MTRVRAVAALGAVGLALFVSTAVYTASPARAAAQDEDAILDEDKLGGG
jgi:hypothetical protein